MELGVGLEYGLTKSMALYLDVRLELFGKPDSAMSFMAEATDGSALPIRVGVNYQF